jgi:hypothetical protein
VIQRLLRFQKAPEVFGDHPRVGVARLVKVNLSQARRPSVLFEVFDEGAGCSFSYQMLKFFISNAEVDSFTSVRFRGSCGGKC